MVPRNGGRAKTSAVELAARSPEPPELDEQIVARAEGLERGTAFDWQSTGSEGWGELFDDEGLLVSPADRSWIVDIERMLDCGGQPAAVEKALALPLRQANLTIETPEGDKGQAEFVRDCLYSSGQQAGMRPDLTQIVAQMTYAIAMSRTFHELVWTRRPDGRFGYKSVAWRPPASCELIRDRRSGQLRGFRQYVDPETIEEMEKRGDPRDVASVGHEEDLGYVRIPAKRAMVHIHGQHRDPINGVSDLKVTYWAYKMQQKILLMWATFLDGQAQSKVITYGSSPTAAKENAKAISTLRGSGVLGMVRDPSNPDQKLFDLLETNGRGAAEFREMISYLKQEMSHSVLAGFLDLTSNASDGIGSYALSADQKGLFLTSRQAAAKEIMATVTDQLIAPLVRVNFGSRAAVPRLVFEKMSEDQSAKAIQLLQQLGSANSIHVPAGFMDLLTEQVGQYLDLPDEKVQKVLEEHAELQRQMAEQAGRPPEESGTEQGRLTDTVNAGLSVLQRHKKEAQ